MALLLSSALAAPPDADVAAQLAAGEFAPVLAAARASGVPAERDELLGRLAAGQAAAGERRAAYSSLSEFSNDLARSESLRSLPRERGAAGGAAQADFDSLIELITATIQPQTWDEVGGPGAIDEFAGGVYCAPTGLLRPLLRVEAAPSLSILRDSSAPAEIEYGCGDPRREAPIRKVSLTRLEREVQFRRDAGLPLDESMQFLAGLRRVTHVFVYPETGEIVIAGPAGAWRREAEERVVAVADGSPVLRLDDLVVVFRQILRGDAPQFGCSITPTREGLARVKAYLEKSSAKPLPPGEKARREQLARLQQELGEQTIDVYGLDPGTRAARVLVEADYRMKLVGLGLEEGVLGCPSYLDLVKQAKNGPESMDVLRWWFTLNYQAVEATAARDAFQISGQGVQVLSENERITGAGERVHTGQATNLNTQFAQNFTDKFPALCTKYPVYAELRNLFDLALAAAIVRTEKLDERARWRLVCFGDEAAFSVARGPAPERVESVMNYTVLAKAGSRQKQLVTAVSGGVRVDPVARIKSGLVRTTRYGELPAEHKAGAPKQLPRTAWWWD